LSRPELLLGLISIGLTRISESGLVRLLIGKLIQHRIAERRVDDGLLGCAVFTGGGIEVIDALLGL
jgi:hypothetical protein